MSAADGLALVVLAGLGAYAVLGGADFGAGLWHLTRSRTQRDLLVKAVGPVWEANHVWLIFVVITLFSGFPGAFGALSRALVAPVSLALLGIVLRGAAFVFHTYGGSGDDAVRGTRAWGHVFAVSSLLTPFAFGAAAGALADGTPRADGSTGLWTPYLAPLPLAGGLLAVACCAYVAAVFLTRDAERIGGGGALVARMRRRALGAGVVAGALALVALPLLPPALAGDLRGIGLPAVAVSAAAGVVTLVLLWRRRYSLARVAAAAAPLGLLTGWAVALHPEALPGTPLAAAAAPPVIAGPVLAVLLVGLALVAPAYVVMVRVLRAR